VSDESIVIVGAGHAGVQLCASLIEAGQGHRVHLLSAEQELPYHRPPLSKSFLKQAKEPTQLLREAAWFERAGVQLSLGQMVVAIDRQAKTVTLRHGGSVSYGQLVLATGTRARIPPAWSLEATNVHVLRTARDARVLRQALQACSAVTILGGGFIGLEVAATCASLGKQVRVLEAGSRLMGRAVSPALSDHVVRAHRAAGIDIELQASARPQFHGDRLVRLTTDFGQHDVDLLLVAVGAQPESDLAQAAGLRCDDGIVVDAQLRTSDPHILAIGDGARFPWGQAHLRLESIQNAQDQARLAASTLLGGPAALYRPMPWFWSEQGALRLQMVGLLESGPVETYRREGAQPGALSLFHYQQGILRCAESVNAPADYLVARKWLEAGLSPPLDRLTDLAIPLRAILAPS
jgi:3-phenylpropionate/trans-cinnamate dioxygenase ferredoxin reductase subunit